MFVEKMAAIEALTGRSALLVLVLAGCASAWQVYNTSNSPLYSNTITDMASDHSGTVYVHGSNSDSILAFLGGSWRVAFVLPRDSAPCWISRVHVAPGGDVWCGTEGRADLFRISGTAVSVYRAPNTCPTGTYYQPMGTDAAGRLVLHVRGRRNPDGTPVPTPRFVALVRYDGNACVPIRDPYDSLETQWGFTTYARDSSGTEWYGRQRLDDYPMCDGVYHLGADSLKQVSGTGDLCVYGLFSDSSATYIGLMNGLLVIDSQGAVRSIDSVLGEHLSEVSAVLRDSRGNLWVGKSGRNKVLRITGTDTIGYGNQNGPFAATTNGNVMFLAEDATGRIWCGTVGSGVIVWDSVASSVRDKPANRSAMSSPTRRPSEPRYDLGGRPLRLCGGCGVCVSRNRLLIVRP